MAHGYGTWATAMAHGYGPGHDGPYGLWLLLVMLCYGPWGPAIHTRYFLVS
jgi:hypothetical protein